MTEIETLVRELREREFIVEESGPGHPREWLVFSQMYADSKRNKAAAFGTEYKPEVGAIYALESGRILHIGHREAKTVGAFLGSVFDMMGAKLTFTDVQRVVADTFGPDFKTLAQVCGGQAPTIGRVVHVFGTVGRTSASLIQWVRDNGDIEIEFWSVLNNTLHTLVVPYEVPEPEANGVYWLWPRVVR